MWDSGNVYPGTNNEGPPNHSPGGANVLFFDGHVEFARYPAPYGSKFFVVSKAVTEMADPWLP